ncbi:tyrosine-type recombinase/integrase [Paenibacillus sp. GCM10027627]|uniref:tyrosine-type recombinase/integrase n=1 Tax=unclassified Paenibacillus TaxID=185978 RepID=UPI0036391BBD
MSKSINMNMLRDRALKLPEVTDKMLKEIRSEHLLLMNEYLEISSGSLSKQSISQYRSALGQFFWWVHIALNDKPLEKISKRDFLRYISYLSNRGMSSSALALKKAAVSSLNNYIENVVADDDETFKMFRNFTRGLPAIPKNKVYNKVKITKDEYDLTMQTLEEDENYLGMAWVATAFNIGARRSEIPQLRTEILSYPIPEDQNYIMSHIIRLKGRSEQGKQEAYMVNQDALHYMRIWTEKRGYENDHIFTIKYNGSVQPMSPSWADDFCSNVLSDILGRRINPHLFKASCITYLLEVKKVPIEIVSKYIAHHENIATTISHYDLRDFAEEKNKIFG